jgi:hypothetical protein
VCVCVCEGGGGGYEICVRDYRYLNCVCVGGGGGGMKYLCVIIGT